MSRDSFEISERGLKLPYGRFLSDAAGGYALILVIIAANLNGTPLPSWLAFFPTNINTGTAVLLAIPIILIGAPLGLVLNGIGWLSLGWIQVKFVDRWIKLPDHHLLKARSTMRAFYFELLDDCFHIKKPSPNQPALYDQVATFDELLQVHFPDAYDSISYVSGVKQFVRNLILISLTIFAYSLYIQVFFVSFVMIVITALFIVFILLLEIYQVLQTLMKVYIICLESWNNDLRTYRSFETVIADLIAIAKGRSTTTTPSSL